MNGLDLVNLTLIALNNVAVMQRIMLKMQAEGRSDLTPDEVAEVRALAVSSNDALQAKINA